MEGKVRSAVLLLVMVASFLSTVTGDTTTTDSTTVTNTAGNTNGDTTIANSDVTTVGKVTTAANGINTGVASTPVIANTADSVTTGGVVTTASNNINTSNANTAGSAASSGHVNTATNATTTGNVNGAGNVNTTGNANTAGTVNTAGNTNTAANAANVGNANNATNAGNANGTSNATTAGNPNTAGNANALSNATTAGNPNTAGNANAASNATTAGNTNTGANNSNAGNANTGNTAGNPGNIGNFLQGLLSSINSTGLQNALGSLFNGANGTTPDLTSMLNGLLSGGSKAAGTDLSSILGGLLSGGANATGPGLSSLLGGGLSQLPAGLGSLLANSILGAFQISPACGTGMSKMVQGLMSREQWALEMIDAFGKPEARLLHGNLHWLGSYSECIGVVNGIAKVDGRPAHVSGQYCNVDVELKSILPPQLLQAGLTGIKVGTCFPDSCSNQDVTNLLMAAQNLLNISKPFKVESECKPKSKELRGDAIAVIVVLCIFGSIIALGTLYDALAVQLPAKKQTTEDKPAAPVTNIGVKTYTNGAYQVSEEEKLAETSLNNGQTNGTMISPSEQNMSLERNNKTNGHLSGASLNHININVPVHNAHTSQERTTMEKLLLSFSVYSNGVKILSPNQGGSLGALNGIRVLSMAWVILGHTYFFSIFPQLSSNGMEDFFKRYNEHWSFLGLGNATFSVDTFFTLSGTLVTYFTLVELKKAGGAKRFKWVMFYVHRYWRLTPIYMLVIMTGTVLLPYLVTGPLAPTGYDLVFMGSCRRTWWTNLLYINNYVQTDDPCLGWSWYLANDMQFYIISPLLIVPLFYSAIAGVVSCLIFLAATITAVAYVTIQHEYPAQTLLAGAYLHPKDGDYQKNLYFPSYARMGPYIIGVFTGYLLYKWNCKCRIPRIINVGCWLIAFCSSGAIIYGIYNHYTDHLLTDTESVIYMATSRVAWGIVVSWVIFACATGHGGWVNEVLSWKPFVPLGRLTYAAYLIHPLVMLVFYAGREQLTYFSNFETTYLFLGHMALSYGGGFLVSLAFEAPMMGIEKALLKRGR